MKIHTSKYYSKIVINILNELELKYKIKPNKYLLNQIELFKWYNLPSFNWYENKNIVFDVDLPTNKRDIFFKKFNKKPTKLNYIHFHKIENVYKFYEYYITHKINPKYPIYILSKGRYNKTLTADTLYKMSVPFKIVIEESEYDKYLQSPSITKDNILILPNDYKSFQNNILGYGGGIPARNYIWNHASINGYKKHWILDDNIQHFYRFDRNVKKKVNSGVVFKIIEDYSDRYNKIGLCAPHYYHTFPAIDTTRKMIIVNSRCYSCILVNNELIDNTIPRRWRGSYNEDTDLTLRVLQSGLNTFLFSNILCGKKTSGSMKGGNTDSIYEGGSHSGYQKKFNELYNNWKHTGWVKYTNKRHKDGRPHHHISYTKIFKHQPVLKSHININELKKKGINNYNMLFLKINT